MAFAPHIYPAVIGEDLILFDTLADRYVALPGSLAAMDDERGVDPSGRNGIRLQPGAIETLRSASLLISSADIDYRALTSPSKQLDFDFQDAASIGLADFSDIVASLIWTGLRLRTGLPCREFRRVRASVSDSDDRKAFLISTLARLRHARLLIPTPRRCLPAAVLTTFFLKRHGIASELVFGVRSHPFEAHCWVERGGMVLDDHLDKVRAYTPIAVGVL